MSDCCALLKSRTNMQPVLIYDPERVPKHWVNLLRPGQFAVFLRDVFTDITLDHQGTPVPNIAAQRCFIFDNLADAKKFCQELVGRAQNARCAIYDERGMAVPPLYTIVNKRHGHRIGTKKTARRLILGGVFALVLSVPLFWYDWVAQGARMWPTIIGINVVFAGLRLLHWGYSEVERLRLEEAEQALAEAKSKSLGKVDE